MPAYQAEEWIGETLESVLAQSSPPDEVVVVDDGSTDGTAGVARSFGERVRLVQQDNAGPSAAYNRAFARVHLRLRRDVPRRRPVGAPQARGSAGRPRRAPGRRRRVRRRPVLRDRGARLRGPGEPGAPGPARLLPRHVPGRPRARRPPRSSAAPCGSAWAGFREDLAAEDYEFWLRALRGRRALLLRPANPRATAPARRQRLVPGAPDVGDEPPDPPRVRRPRGDPRLARQTLARDLRKIGRCRLGLGEASEARRAYGASLRQVPRPSAAAWAALLSVPGMSRAVAFAAARRASA